MNQSTRTVAAKYLKRQVHLASIRRTAAAGVRLDQKVKRKINDRFRQEGLGERANFEKAEHGYSKTWEILAEFGIVVEQVIDHFLFVDRGTADGRADDGHTNLHLAQKTDDPFTNIPITNSLLVFTFHRKDNGQFGCLCYVS